MRKHLVCLFSVVLSCLLLLTGCNAEAGMEIGKDATEKHTGEIGGSETEKATGEIGGEETEKHAEVSVYCMTGLVHTDNYGDLVYVASYEADGIHLAPQSIPEGDEVYQYVYGWDGRRLLERLVRSDGSEVSRTEFTYDENGNLTERAYTYPENNSASGRIYEYDSQGKLLRLCFYSKPGEISNVYAYTYDENGFVTECLVTDNLREPQWRYVYTCDEEGKIVRGQRYVLSEKLGKVGLQSDLLYTYDAAGRLLGIAWKPVFENNKLRISKFFTYDEQGRVIGYQTYHQETAKDIDQVFTYDEEGYLIRVAEANGVVKAFTYGYVTLDSALAEYAQQWSTAGVIKVYTPSTDPLYQD